ncbi:carboxypeptidase-like regulatory domain-containing protein [Flammeovirga kamogawensis]|uniref:DUF5686 and carboxypeptidase regulatory-like domain-containing protein n=1 Tax=Flammeovirga kamogawensis TaxID=373891 RepID=A0ABX8H034_9BACT|nr:DUF5686 and carboxypeptidase regulatory-like domain-containing protein [Flammeovirga kamogawensis]TRX67190.1 carboxypeptidase-like regulatory domain-containing protein [Flammeovirga kamogawensis]
MIEVISSLDLSLNQFFRTTLLSLLLTCSVLIGNAQEIQWAGKVIDSSSLRPVGFAHLTLLSSGDGTSTDEKGKFIISISSDTVTLEISCLGYASKLIKLDTLDRKESLIYLDKAAHQLEEVVVGRRGYENPAWEIIRLAMKNADTHNFQGQEDFQYQSKMRTNIFLADINKEFTERKLIASAIKRMEAIDSLKKDDNGKPLIPMYVSHSEQKVSYNAKGRAEDRDQFYYKEAFLGPEFENQFKEGLDNEKTTVNFYQHWLRFLRYDFASPLNPSFKNFYDFELVTYEKIDKDWCYKINYIPRRENDQTFGGTIWITDEEKGFAIKKVYAEIGRKSPLNFIDSITVEQKMAPLDTTQIWFPYQQNIKLWVGGKLKENWQKFLVDIETENTFITQDSTINFEEVDTTTFAMIDTVKQMPTVKSAAKIADIAVTGYYRMGGFDFGPLTVLYAQNNVEEHRIQVGGLTNTQWNKNLIGGGYVAYGTNDQEWKWGAMAKYILNHDTWTFLYARAQHSLQRLGAGITYPGQDPYLWISQAWGTYSNPYYLDEAKLIAGTYISEGIQLRGQFTYKDENYFATELTDTLAFSNITTAEIGGSIIFDFGKRYVSSRHLNRYVAANGKLPTISLSYQRGLPSVLGATDSYHKVEFNLSHRFKLGTIGRLDYGISSGWTPSTVPFPLLFVHRGNNLRYIYSGSSYNLMGFGEFMSDQYASIRVFHHFEGLVLNRLPLLKKWNAKTFVLSNILWGSVSDANQTANVNPWDENSTSFGSLDPSTPYVEVGGGVENIFRMVKVMFIYRATYQENASRKYGIMFAFSPEF